MKDVSLCSCFCLFVFFSCLSEAIPGLCVCAHFWNNQFQSSPFQPQCCNHIDLHFFFLTLTVMFKIIFSSARYQNELAGVEAEQLAERFYHQALSVMPHVGEWRECKVWFVCFFQTVLYCHTCGLTQHGRDVGWFKSCIFLARTTQMLNPV